MPKMKNAFWDLYSFESRRQMGEKFRKNYPGKIPVIVQRSSASRVGSDKVKKYIVPDYLTFGHLYYLIRSYLHLRPEEAVVLYVKNVIPASASTLASIYEAYHDEDYFLYVVYQEESVYGGCSDLPSEGKSGNSNDETGEEGNGHENQGNQPVAVPDPETGENVNDPPNGDPLPIIQVNPPEGNGGAVGHSLEGASGGAAGTSGNTASGPVMPHYQIMENNSSFSRLVCEFFLSNRRLLHSANGTDHPRPRPTRFNPFRTLPDVPTGGQDRQPVQDISGAMSNVNVSYGDELELAAGDSSDVSTSDEEDADAVGDDDAAGAATTEALVGGAIGDTDVPAGGPAEAAMGWLSGDADVGVAGLILDADAATGGPAWEADAEVGGSAGDDDAGRGSPNRDNDSGAGSIGGDVSYGLGSIGEASATDTTGGNEDSGAGTYGGIDAAGDDATGESLSSAGSSDGEDAAVDGDRPVGDEGHDGGNNAGDDYCALAEEGAEGN